MCMRLFASFRVQDLHVLFSSIRIDRGELVQVSVLHEMLNEIHTCSMKFQNSLTLTNTMG